MSADLVKLASFKISRDIVSKVMREYPIPECQSFFEQLIARLDEDTLRHVYVSLIDLDRIEHPLQ